MFERIVVPLDETEHAECALPVAARIAHATNGTLIVMSVVLPLVECEKTEVSRTVGTHPMERQTRPESAPVYLDEVLQRYAPALEGVKTEQVVTAGAASPTMFEEARLHRGDLVVLCSQGESRLKNWIFGNVAKQAARHRPVPAVLALNEQGVFPPFSLQERLLRVLVPLDGSPLAETALEPTLRLMAALAGSTQTVLHLLEVVHLPIPSGRALAFPDVEEMMEEEEVQQAQSYLHEEMSNLLAHLPTKLNLTMTYSVVPGMDVAKAILAEVEPAEDEQEVKPYDFIAMTTHGWEEPRRLHVGSVTRQLLETTRLPLLVLRSPEKETEQNEQQMSAIATKLGSEGIRISQGKA
jgi:nucleotide-binding universal stress UspA family protein